MSIKPKKNEPYWNTCFPKRNNESINFPKHIALLKLGLIHDMMRRIKSSCLLTPRILIDGLLNSSNRFLCPASRTVTSAGGCDHDGDSRGCWVGDGRVGLTAVTDNGRVGLARVLRCRR